MIAMINLFTIDFIGVGLYFSNSGIISLPSSLLFNLSWEFYWAIKVLCCWANDKLGSYGSVLSLGFIIVFSPTKNCMKSFWYFYTNG